MNAFLWILIIGFFSSFFTSWGIGANDAANSFATSVGANVLTLKQAVLIAAICEFLGAVLLGSRVTDTIRKKIVNHKVFEDDPYVLMFGMLCASIATGLWLLIATYMKWPVSTTHSTIGAVVGFALVHDADAINTTKLTEVVISWVISPLLAGGITMVLLVLNIVIVLNKKEPLKWARRWMPIMVTMTVWLIVMFIIYKGAPQLKLNKLDITDALWISFATGVVVGFLTFLSLRFSIFTKLERYIRLKLLKDNVEQGSNNDSDEHVDIDSVNDADVEDNKSDKLAVPELNEEPKSTDLIVPDNYSNGYASDTDSEHKYGSNKFHGMKLYDEETEDLYSYLQVFTAIVSSFAHGSNDVANSIAPLAAMYAIYQDGSLEKKSDVPIWILVIGGVGIVIGLSTWGYRIIDRMGKELSGVTPVRGVSIELGAAVAVLIASRMELPVSTTHCQVGSIVGSGLIDSFRKNGCVGLCSNKLPNVDLSIFARVVFAWVITLPIAGGLSAALFAFAREAP